MIERQQFFTAYLPLQKTAGITPFSSAPIIDMVYFGKRSRTKIDRVYNSDAKGCTAVDLDALKRRGIKGLFLDLDNTLRPHSHNPEPISGAVRMWIQHAKELDFKLYILTNNMSKIDVESVSRELEISAISRANKPFVRRKIENVLEQWKLSKDEVVIIGDHACLDGLGGKWAGIPAIVVEPIDRKNERKVSLLSALLRVPGDRYI